MRSITLLGFIVIASSVASPASAQTDAGQRRVLDAVFNAAKPPAQNSRIALTLLEYIALGRTNRIEDGWERSVGRRDGELKDPVFENYALRGYAFRKIGECELPEALEFLTRLRRSDVQGEQADYLWNESQVGLTLAHLLRTPDPAQKVETLKAALKTPASTWAMEELCNQGVLSALPDIQSLMRSYWSGERGKDFAAFCEDRMRVIARDPDRVKALSSVLGSFMRMTNTYEDRRLLDWAITQMEFVGSEEAERALASFQAEVDAILKSDPQALHMEELHWEAMNALMRMKKR